MIDDEKTKQDLVRVASTDEGVRLLRAIMNECGYHKSSVVIDMRSREINIQSTVYNEARRNLWLDLRKCIPRERLILIEHEKQEIEVQKCQTTEPPEQLPAHKVAERRRPADQQPEPTQPKLTARKRRNP